MTDGLMNAGAGSNDRRIGGSDLQHAVQTEKNRHDSSLAHHKHNLMKHHTRSYNSQYGHDTYKYSK